MAELTAAAAAASKQSTESISIPVSSTSTPAPDPDGPPEDRSLTDAGIAEADKVMDELGLPDDDKAAIDAMMAAMQSGEVPSDDMVEKAQRASEHMAELTAAAAAASKQSTE